MLGKFSNLKRFKNKQSSSAFTIVELLVVIVVIAILAAITIVSYSGIRNQAIAASLKSDLSNAAKQIEMYKTENDAYPNSVTDCPTPAAGNICLTSSSGSSFSNYSVDNISGTYSLKAISGDISYSINESGTPTEGVTSWSNIDAGDYHNCSISSLGKVFCWGDNYYGQIGDLTDNTRYMPTATYVGGELANKKIASISAGFAHTCAIDTAGKTYCWGGNDYGKLGSGSVALSNNKLVANIDSALFDSYGLAVVSEGEKSFEAVAVDTSGALSGKIIKQISVGEDHTCAIASDNQAYCWGANYSGQLGNGSTEDSSTPVAVDTSGVLSGKTIKFISSASYHTCAIASDNQAYCWGVNTYGQLGNNSTTDSSIPVAVYTSGVLSGKTVKLINAGGRSTCAIASDNQAYCWGLGHDGEMGNSSFGTTNSQPVAVDTSGVLSGKTIKSIAIGYAHVCALASDNQIYCWGHNGFGQLGDNSTNQSFVPIAINISGSLSGKTIQALSVGGLHTCAIASDNQIYCWGNNNNGQLGINDYNISNSTSPILVVNP